MGPDSSTVHALFRLAAGSRLGYGHLLRGRALARALEIVRPDVSLRGAPSARRAAQRLGLHLVDGTAGAALGRVRPDVLVIDDPSQAAAVPWCETARMLGIPVVSVHDLGKALCGADLAIDGSLDQPRSHSTGLLSGSTYTILDPSIRHARGQLRDPNTILIALGGGPRIGVALEIAAALRSARAELRVRIAGGLATSKRPAPNGVICLGPCDGLANELARCAVAITGGGVSLYEAAALDTPAIAWPVVAGQYPTVRAFHRRHLATAVLPGAQRVTRAVNAVLAALADTSRRRSSETIDGLGAQRVADAIRTLVKRGSREAA